MSIMEFGLASLIAGVCGAIAFQLMLDKLWGGMLWFLFFVVLWFVLVGIAITHPTLICK